MKARPISFSSSMVRALLAGTKSQTRRTVKPQPDCGFIVGVQGSPACPYGAAGDLLYVKEAWRTAKSLDDLDATKIAAKCLDAGYNYPWTPMQFDADGNKCSTWGGFGDGCTPAVPGRYRHARFMPRWASRITLRITDVRVQRLQEISEADAIAEGVEPLDSTAPEERESPDFDPALCDGCGGLRLYTAFRGGGAAPDTDCRQCDTHVKRYQALWTSINSAESWSANPWVWCVSFEVLHKNVDEVVANG